MAKRGLGNHYIRQWRQQKKLSLRRLADRLELEPGGEPLLSYGSLSRIESGDQPYTEETLAAIAEALGVTRSMLLDVNPDMEGEVTEAISIMKRMDRDTRSRALSVLKALAGEKTAA